jgi:RND superfamily putative drug exporter
MNLLSVGAAYGVIALAADRGGFGQVLGIDTATPVAPFIPVMMFAILFGLSMDYEVFLLSRVQEAYLAHGRTHDAVADGLARTARGSPPPPRSWSSPSSRSSRPTRSS